MTYDDFAEHDITCGNCPTELPAGAVRAEDLQEPFIFAYKPTTPLGAEDVYVMIYTSDELEARRILYCCPAGEVDPDTPVYPVTADFRLTAEVTPRIGAEGFGLNEKQQAAIVALWDWQKESLDSNVVLGGILETMDNNCAAEDAAKAGIEPEEQESHE